jgi:hypothetical protein
MSELELTGLKDWHDLIDSLCNFNGSVFKVVVIYFRNDSKVNQISCGC